VIAREIADEPLDARSSENANVALLLAESIRRVPERVAIFDARRGRDAARTFAALEAQTERVAGRLRAAGLDKGSHVLVLVPMSIDLYAVLGAILRIGAVAVVVNPRAGRAYVEACCRMRRPDAVVATPIGFVWGMTVAGIRAIPKRFGTVAFSAGLGNRFAETFSRQDARAARMSERDPESSGPDAAAHAFVAADDPALLTFTSGSTGRPKALLRTHGTMRAQLGALLESLPLNEDDVDVATMPVVLLANLAAGRTSLIPAVRLARPGAVDAGRLLRDIATYRATTIVASPALLERLVERLERCGGTLPQMRAVYSGGAPVMPRLMQRLTTCLPAARVVAVYGSTEAEPIAHLALDDISTADVAAMRAGAGLLAGLPAAAADVRVIRNAWGGAARTVYRKRVLGSLRERGRDRRNRRCGPARDVRLSRRRRRRGNQGSRGGARLSSDGRLRLRRCERPALAAGSRGGFCRGDLRRGSRRSGRLRRGGAVHAVCNRGVVIVRSPDPTKRGRRNRRAPYDRDRAS
jgi:acyl-CoA synthetase (AMP-forming)/AMP-acid ligase II